VGNELIRPPHRQGADWQGKHWEQRRTNEADSEQVCKKQQTHKHQREHTSGIHRQTHGYGTCRDTVASDFDDSFIFLGSANFRAVRY